MPLPIDTYHHLRGVAEAWAAEEQKKKKGLLADVLTEVSRPDFNLTRTDGAIALEPVGTVHPVTPNPCQKMLAVDGSQFGSDRHYTRYPFSLLNVAIFVHDTPKPHIEKFCQVKVGRDALSGSDLAAARNVLEIQTAVQAAAKYQSPLALVDQRLLYRGAGEQEWIQSLQVASSTGRTLAGVVDRPTRTIVMDSIFFELDRSDMYKEIPDYVLFGMMLEPGQRSSVFRDQSFLTAPYAEKNLHICFFYMNIDGNIVRVDILDTDVNKADWIAGSILEDSRTGGYPYALARADEEAVIKADEGLRAADLIRSVFDNYRDFDSPSRKQQSKAVFRGSSTRRNAGHKNLGHN